MTKAFEGKLEGDDFVNEIPQEYFHRRYVPGLAEVAAGVRFAVPTTIYAISGDDTSGVAGLLMPDGDFIPVQAPKRTQRFWEFDETLKFEPVLDDQGNRIPVQGPYGKTYLATKGNSWTEGEVVWDGSVAGSIDLLSQDGEDGDEERSPVYRRLWDKSLTGERETTGELWRAIRRGTAQTGKTEGVQHLNRQSHFENSWDTFGNGRQEAT